MSYSLWSDGEWVASRGGGVMQITHPANGEKITDVVNASGEDVDRAVQAATKAFADGRWSRLTPSDRSRAMWRLADLLEARSQEFARVESDRGSVRICPSSRWVNTKSQHTSWSNTVLRR